MKTMGIDGKGYISADLNEDAPGTPVVWILMDLIEAIEQEMTRAEGTVDNRETQFTRYGSGQIAMGYTITMTYDPDDPLFDLIYNAFLNRTPLALAIMDDDITTVGTKGWLMDVQVFSGPKSDNLNEFGNVPFVFKPTAKSSFLPQRYTVV